MTSTAPASAPLDSARRTALVAVAGNPNCGKTTVFNALTGLRHKVGNYAGVTVEKKLGALTGMPEIGLLDLPGTYSLSAQSPDEQIARDVLLGRVSDTPRPDAVLVVIDANNLERNLFLATQILELGLPAVIACNMMDVVRQAGHELDVAALSEALGVPVIPMVANRGEGMAELKQALIDASRQNQRIQRQRDWRLPEAMEEDVRLLSATLISSNFATESAADGAALLLLNEGEVPSSNHLPEPVRAHLRETFGRYAESKAYDISLEITSARYAWLGELVDECLRRGDDTKGTISDRLDRILTHKILGLLLFTAMMAVVFLGIFVLADPLMGLIETGVEWTQGLVVDAMGEGALRSLITDGIIAGVGNVIVFFPQICILFLAIALLEDTGYMARAAFLMDRLMSRVGLHGKSFIPLLSSHACAIPGIMATRTIENPKDRLATILVAPLMSCSARLPVYIVLITACLPGSSLIKMVTLLSMYTLGIVSALAMATLFKKTLLKGPTPAFIMELPPYRLPRVGAVLRVMWDRSKIFLTRAGTVILALTIVIWAMMSYPKDPAIAQKFESQRAEVNASFEADEMDEATRAERLEQIDNQQASEELGHSVAGRLGQMLEPAIKPLGYDWKIGIGIVGSFAAREVFVSTMGIVYSVGEADEASVPLREQIRASTWEDGSPVFTPLAAVSLMVFYVLACQCASTIAVVRRETNSWRWPIFMFVYMTVLAYVAALVVYQGGSALGIGV